MKKRYAIPLGSLAALLLLLLALHLALPYLVRDYLNGKLADMGDYRGHIADVDLALWRGAYRIDGLSIVKDNGKVPVPFLDAPSIDLSVSWQALWDDHAVVARVVFERPQLNFVDAGGDRDASQTGAGTDCCCATWTCSIGGRTWRMATRTCSARCGRRWSAGARRC